MSNQPTKLVWMPADPNGDVLVPAGRKVVAGDHTGVWLEVMPIQAEDLIVGSRQAGEILGVSRTTVQNKINEQPEEEQPVRVGQKGIACWPNEVALYLWWAKAKGGADGPGRGRPLGSKGKASE